MNRVGKQTIVFKNRPYIRSCPSIVGPKEGQGPLGYCFDTVLEDDLLGKESFELAESEMQKRVIEKALEKGGMTVGKVDAVFSGDLLNQIVASTFAGRETGIPFIGLYGACSTMIEGMALAGALVDGEYMQSVVCATSSHFSSAERQYRFPLEHGNQRPPSAQWTSTAAGAVIIDSRDDMALGRLVNGTIGRVVDYDVKDANHMGAAMAPAVADTLTKHFEDTQSKAEDFDRIITGDLGHIGRALLKKLMDRRGFPIPEEKLFDCGASLFSQDQDVGAGGSGCGCIASVLCGLFLPKLGKGELKKVIALGSGAMLSLTSSQQGQSIPCISYAVTLEGMG